MKKVILFFVCLSCIGSIAEGSGGGVAYLVPPSNIFVAKDGSQQEVRISSVEFWRLLIDLKGQKEVSIEGMGKFVPSERPIALVRKLWGTIGEVKTLIITIDENE